jgi:hypothetical protein
MYVPWKGANKAFYLFKMQAYSEHKKDNCLFTAFLKVLYTIYVPTKKVKGTFYSRLATFCGRNAYTSRKFLLYILYLQKSKRYQRHVFSSGNARQRILYKPDPERYLKKIQGLCILIFRDDTRKEVL